MTKPKRHATGMNTHHGQAKDRVNWNKSIELRKTLIEQARALHIKLNRPHEMKIADLQSIVESGVQRAAEKRRKKSQTENKT